MTDHDEIRRELEKKNRETRQKIKRQKDEQEFREYLDDLGIDRIDAPATEKKKTHSGRRSEK
jgi:uncharacterized protein YjiS (DUF1127 family)